MLPVDIVLATCVIGFSLVIYLHVLIGVVRRLVAFSHERDVQIFICNSGKSNVGVTGSLQIDEDGRFELGKFVSSSANFVKGRAVKYEMCTGGRSLFSVLRRREVRTVVISSRGIRQLRASNVVSQLVTRSVHVLAIPPFGSLKGRNVRVGSVRVRSLLRESPVRMSVQGVSSRVRKGEVVVAKTTNSVKHRVIERVTKLGPCGLVLISRTRSPLRGMRLRLLSG